MPSPSPPLPPVLTRRSALTGAGVAALALGGLAARPARGPAHDDHAATPGATPAATPGSGAAGTATPVTLAGTGVGGLYLTVANAGPAADTLLGGATDVCRAVMPHAMRADGDVMAMVPLPDGMPVPAGATVTLGPDGDHLMLDDLTRDLLPGQPFAATVRFADAGDVPLTVAVAWDEPAAGAFAPPVAAGTLTVSAAWSRPAPMIGG